MSLEEKLSEVYKAEKEQDWPKVFAQYKELYQQFPVQKVAIHFAFFCWYLLWQWDEIVFPGEQLSFHERITLDIRNGMSKSELLSSLNCMASKLLASMDKTEDKYLAILIHMHNIYPYFFESNTLSSEFAEQIFVYLEKKQTTDFVTKRICLYQRNTGITQSLGGEKTDDEMFPSDGSLIANYFQWLFRG